MPPKFDTETIIIGGGQAGLAVGYHLMQRGREAMILEQAAQAANAWRNDRWDSFALLTPNWSFRLPGAEYRGDAPDGFMPRAEIVACFEQYIQRYHLPVHFGVRVTSVEQIPGGQGYRVETGKSSLQAKNVVVATGLYQRPRLPSSSSSISARITQLHSGQYRNPQSLPPGAVLIVGSAQSGCQIAEELYQVGRKVYLCTGSAGRAPRRYRGKDAYEWLNLCGFLDRTPDKLPSPRAKFAGNPHLSGRDGGHTINLHQFVRDGVVLLGRLNGASERKIWLAPDLKDNLAKADKFEADIVKLIDGYILQAGLDLPPENLPQLRDGYDAEAVAELDLQAEGVAAIIWALGYEFDFSLVKLPIFDSDGYPIQKRGATEYPGIFFMGLPWLSKQKSGLLIGVGEDADYIASAITAREGNNP